MGLIVQKYGGTSVANAEKLRNVAERIAKVYDEGNQIIVVVSAMGKFTDELIAKASEVNDKPSRREMDVLLSTGEQITIALLSMTLEKMGYPVISLTGWQVAMRTDRNNMRARYKRIETQRIESELDKNKIVIVAGFQGVNSNNDITTLGRGGSDTTAVALAATFCADVCEIYTDVDGIYTTDPRIVPDAKKLKDISYGEMLEMASLGANVLHNRSVEMAEKYNVNMEVKSSFTNIEGTKVKEVSLVEEMIIRGVTRDNDVARISVIGLKDVPGIAYKLFNLMALKNICVDIILQSIGRENTKDISFTVSTGQLQEALDVLNENITMLGASDVQYTEDVAKVSIVGAGMQSHPGVAAKMFEALYESQINIHMISTSEIKISVLISKRNAEKAVSVIHEKFFHGE